MQQQYMYTSAYTVCMCVYIYRERESKRVVFAGLRVLNRITTSTQITQPQTLKPPNSSVNPKRI